MRWNRTTTVVNYHVEGEIGRVVGAMPRIPGDDAVFDRRVFLQNHRDDPRPIIFCEPGRSHHNVNALAASTAMGRHPRMHSQYLARAAVEHDVRSHRAPRNPDTSRVRTGNGFEARVAGRTDQRDVRVKARRSPNKFTSSTPAFCNHLDAAIDTPDTGNLVDVASGGMTSVMAERAQLGLNQTTESTRESTCPEP